MQPFEQIHLGGEGGRGTPQERPHDLTQKLSHHLQVILLEVLCYLVKVISKGDLTGDQFMGQVIILLFQSHTGFLKTTILPLQTHSYKIYQSKCVYM